MSDRAAYGTFCYGISQNIVIRPSISLVTTVCRDVSKSRSCCLSDASMSVSAMEQRNSPVLSLLD